MKKAIAQLSLDGRCLVFDFINTIGSRKAVQSNDYLQTWSDFITWLTRLKAMPKGKLRQLVQFSDVDPKTTERTMTKVRDTREILYRVFSALPVHKKPEKIALDRFNDALRESFAHISLEIRMDGSDISFAEEKTSLEEPLRIILKSAFDILTDEDYAKIKECPACGWLFLDRTKNNKRRWCSMTDCGSKDKAARYYQRKQGR
jgi:predicted RNA-binding Zn ribbon-like protein